jgi:hypothetical protein
VNFHWHDDMILETTIVDLFGEWSGAYHKK